MFVRRSFYIFVTHNSKHYFLSNIVTYVRQQKFKTQKYVFLSSNVVLEEVYVDVPVTKEIEVENKTSLSTYISWSKVSMRH